MRYSKLTVLQREQLRRAVAQGTYIRARNHGERVTLASLFYRGFLERRAWRGKEGERDAAYEYATRGTAAREAERRLS